jgi:PAS domain-containing protein
LLDRLIPYFKSGLKNNEFCLWVISEPLEIEGVKEALRRAMPDFNTYLEKGQIEVIPYTDWFTTEGVFDSGKVSNTRVKKLNHALDCGYDGMRLSGNTSWLEKESWDSFIEFKEQTDKNMGNYQLINLCTYPLDKHNAAEIIDVVVNHQFALIKRDGKWKRMESAKRKQAEEAALRATKNWEHTLDILPDPIAILDNEYRILRANRVMAARLGMTPEECVGMACYRVVHGTDEPPSFCPHRQVLKDGLEHTREVREESPWWLFHSKCLATA